MRALSLIAGKASQAEVAKLSQLVDSKTDLESVKTLLQIVEDRIRVVPRIVETSPRDLRAETELFETLASHSQQLRNAELVRYVFLDVVNLLGMRFEPDHHTIFNRIRNGRGEVSNLYSTFATTWPRDLEVTRTGTQRVGGGYRYEVARPPSPWRVGSTRPLSASMRAQQAVRSTRGAEEHDLDATSRDARDFRSMIY